jgi:predicted signal transduction protein with EAL and GGDEF domain
VGLAGSWLQFRGEPAPGSRSAAYGNLLLVSRARVIGRLALGRWIHAAVGLQAGQTLVGVAARDSGQVVRSASGLVLGATLGLETP